MKKFKLYQIKNDPQVPRGIKFSGLDFLKRFGLRDKLTLSIYDQVYSGELEADDVDEMLETIFMMFQGIKPADYKGHSVSVSDLVEIEGKFYYCDHIGWAEIEIK